MYLIYKITNPHNRRAYVGITRNVDDRMRWHRRNLTVECRDFDIEILMDDIPSGEEAQEMEKVFIDVHQTFADDGGYNKTRGGGRNYQVSKETRQKLSEAHKGGRHTEESRRKIGDAHRGMKRRPETGRRISEANKGKIISEEQRKQISETLKGHKQSPEMVRKRVEGRKKSMSDPEFKRKYLNKKRNSYLRNRGQLTLFDE